MLKQNSRTIPFLLLPQWMLYSTKEITLSVIILMPAIILKEVTAGISTIESSPTTLSPIIVLEMALL